MQLLQRKGGKKRSGNAFQQLAAERRELGSVFFGISIRYRGRVIGSAYLKSAA